MSSRAQPSRRAVAGGQTENTGFVQLHRSILNWEWWTDRNTRDVFIYLIIACNYKPGTFMNTKIDRGSIATSYRHIGAAVGITYEQARLAIKHLKTTGEITVRQYSKFLLLKLNNYEQYQGRPQAEAQAQPTLSTRSSQQSNNRINNNAWAPHREVY